MTELILPRRKFLTGLGASIIAAPAVVRAASLMKISAFEDEIGLMQMVNGGAFRYSELSAVTRAAVTRAAFVPSIYLQIYKGNPLLKQFIEGAAR